MKELPVTFAPEARNDLIEIYDQISERADPVTAIGYVERIEAFCARLSIGSMRGSTHHEVREGLRVIGFEKNLSVAFVVEDDRVVVLRLFYGGRNWSDPAYWR